MGLALFDFSITHMGSKWDKNKNFFIFFRFFDKISPFEIDVYIRQGKAGLVWERQTM